MTFSRSRSVRSTRSTSALIPKIAKLLGLDLEILELSSIGVPEPPHPVVSDLRLPVESNDSWEPLVWRFLTSISAGEIHITNLLCNPAPKVCEYEGGRRRPSSGILVPLGWRHPLRKTRKCKIDVVREIFSWKWLSRWRRRIARWFAAHWTKDRL